MLQQDPFHDFLDDVFLVGVQATDTLEQEQQAVVGLALAGLENELVGGDAERNGQLLDDIQGRLRTAALVAIDLGLGDAGPTSRAC